MVSAGAASKKVFGIDRSGESLERHSAAEVILVAGANIAECAPITTDYIWQARRTAAKLIVIDPRMTPIARNADLFIPVRPGGDIGVFQRNAAHHDQAGMDRSGVHREEHHWFRGSGRSRRRSTHRNMRRRLRAFLPSMIVKAAEMWGPAKTSFLLHARGIEHHSKGVENCIATIQSGVGDWAYWSRRLRLRDDHRPGQRPG